MRRYPSRRKTGMEREREEKDKEEKKTEILTPSHTAWTSFLDSPLLGLSRSMPTVF